MVIGTLGTVTFQASSEVVETIHNLKWTSSGNYTQHQVHGGKAVPEFIGRNCDQITFEILLSIFVGTNPLAELDKLSGMLKSGVAYPLVMGTDVYGKWLVSSVSRSFDHLFQDGSLISAKAQITLLEAGEGV